MSWNRICLMVPTYKRANTSLPVYINSAVNTASNRHRACFCVCVNQNDIESLTYLNNLNVPCDVEVIKENSTKPDLAAYFNQMYENTKFNDPKTVVSMTGDDMIFETQDWDLKLLDIINSYDGLGVFWCNDAFIARERMCVNMFVTRKFVEATERPFMCPVYPADMIDWVWHKVGKYSKNLHYLPDVIIRHNHETQKPNGHRDETFERLVPYRKSAHDNYGKEYARAYARDIAERLISKGMMGDNV